MQIIMRLLTYYIGGYTSFNKKFSVNNGGKMIIQKESQSFNWLCYLLIYTLVILFLLMYGNYIHLCYIHNYKDMLFRIQKLSFKLIALANSFTAAEEARFGC